MKKLSSEQKSVILALRQENLSARSIANKVGCSHVTVLKLIKKFAITKSTERASGTGKSNKKTTQRMDRKLKNMCLTNRFSTSNELSNEVRERFGTNISARTVRRRLQQMGLNGRRPRKKPGLTKKMQIARLDFAKKYRNWTENDWKRVIFSDESKISINQSDGITYVRRKVNEDLHQDTIITRNKFPISFMVWGCISYYGCGDLAIINGTLNANGYIDILKNFLDPSIERLFPITINPVFQDDSAPCHRAKKVKEYIQQIGMEKLSWPGNSPDMNPIENCWAILKKRVNKKNPTTKLELKQALTEAWENEISVEYCRNLINFVPDRIAAVIKARGRHTKY